MFLGEEENMSVYCNFTFWLGSRQNFQSFGVLILVIFLWLFQSLRIRAVRKISIQSLRLVWIKSEARFHTGTISIWYFRRWWFSEGWGFGGIPNVPVLGCQACRLRNLEAACWSVSSEIWLYLMNLKWSIQKQKHSASLITVTDLTLTVSIKNNSS